MKQTINEKEGILQEILLKTLSLKNLIKRNMDNSNSEEDNEKIHFPFIALELDCDPNRNSVIKFIYILFFPLIFSFVCRLKSFQINKRIS